ncbi:hypothetical protein CANMA_004739 [Candida margitis]|uniref:uncharacterized protein n=1 Tax=Candida margitis TaxID=1775924 RepID=UPI002226B3BF|nr:uncharacterized protein CANMA_004739 [Candida margitis]KAI5953900.1 hypothetical protein CANMA_004739 [Candida margitis]
MGICFSCLGGSSSEDEYDETTSLLRRNQQGTYDQLQEEELIKQQQRQQELSNIVNDLSENLIDVTSFLSKGNASGIYSQSQSQVLQPNNNSGLVTQTSNTEHTLGEDGEGSTRIYPYVYKQSDKTKVVEQAKKLPDTVRQACQISVSEPLYLKF